VVKATQRCPVHERDEPCDTECKPLRVEFRALNIMLWQYWRDRAKGRQPGKVHASRVSRRA
jgi:hypothetical protein